MAHFFFGVAVLALAYAAVRSGRNGYGSYRGPDKLSSTGATVCSVLFILGIVGGVISLVIEALHGKH
jgi:hypothetical protein